MKGFTKFVLDTNYSFMKRLFFTRTILILFVLYMSISVKAFEKDIFKTSQGDLAITFIGHGTLMMEFQGKVIHIDPVVQYADYATLPKADLILITHEHGDHLDLKAIGILAKPSTEVVLTKTCLEKYPLGKVMANGETKSFQGLKIEAVPAYNLEKAFHPKGSGNGYIIICGDKKIYVAGDTENIPEMANLKNIDVAFLPMNLPFTMTPEMVAGAARMFKPAIVYPYHYGNTDVTKLVDLLREDKGIEVRIRNLK
jgi:L-ascorbate metabolism protein UlaG (beta-lactamase superfamily)